MWVLALLKGICVFLRAIAESCKRHIFLQCNAKGIAKCQNVWYNGVDKYQKANIERDNQRDLHGRPQVAPTLLKTVS